MIRPQNVLKMSLRRICETYWRCLEDIMKTFLQDVFKTSWKRLEDVWTRRIYWSWPRRFEDVFIKTIVCWVIIKYFIIDVWQNYEYASDSQYARILSMLALQKVLNQFLHNKYLGGFSLCLEFWICKYYIGFLRKRPTSFLGLSIC